MLQTTTATGKLLAATPDRAGDVVAHRAEIVLTAGQLTLNQIIEMLPLPAGCRVVDAILDSDDLDSNGTPLVTVDVGFMSGDFGVSDAARTIGAEFFSASTVAQAGGVARPTLKTAFRTERSDADRGVGIKISAIPATAAGGTIGLTLLYRG
jgi:hypothetical protein